MCSNGGNGDTLTEIDTGADSVVAPELSVARAVRTQEPEVMLVQVANQGLAALWPILFVPAKNWTLVTMPSRSLAVAETTIPAIGLLTYRTALLTGFVIVTSGRSVALELLD